MQEEAYKIDTNQHIRMILSPLYDISEKNKRSNFFWTNSTTLSNHITNLIVTIEKQKE